MSVVGAVKGRVLPQRSICGGKAAVADAGGEEAGIRYTVGVWVLTGGRRVEMLEVFAVG